MMFLSDSLVRLCPVAPPHVQCYISTGTFTTRATGAEEFLRKQAVKFLVESLKGTKKQDMVADSRIVQNTHKAFKGVPCRAWVDFWPLEDNLAEVQEEEYTSGLWLDLPPP